MSFMKEAQLRRAALYKMAKLVGQHSSHPEVLKLGTMDDIAKRIATAFKAEADPQKKFRLLLAATGLAAHEALWLLEAPDSPDEIIVDLGVYDEWKQQDSEYRKRFG